MLSNVNCLSNVVFLADSDLNQFEKFACTLPDVTSSSQLSHKRIKSDPSDAMSPLPTIGNVQYDSYWNAGIF